MRPLLALLASLSILACGGETDSNPTNTENVAGSSGSGGSAGSAGSAGAVETVDCSADVSLIDKPCATEGEDCGRCNAPGGPLYTCQNGIWKGVTIGFCDDSLPGNSGGCSDPCVGISSCGVSCKVVFNEGPPGACQGIPMHGFCDGQGTCQVATPPACVTEPCKGKVCGDACAVDDSSGQCSYSGACLIGAEIECQGAGGAGGEAGAGGSSGASGEAGAGQGGSAGQGK